MTKERNNKLELPGKDCGLCGFKTCDEFAAVAKVDKKQMKRCIHLTIAKGKQVCSPSKLFSEEAASWKDHLGRDYDFILDKFPDEAGPRETIILFNPSNVEKLQLKKGDIIFGRPAWISCGCPVTHVGQIVEEPDYFNGCVTWCIVGPMMARKNAINIGYYNTTAYEGLVKVARTELEIGRRYYFQPRFCMLQWRHCGLINHIARRSDGFHVRIEGLWIG
ncbi:MAG: Fe-S cluster protein [Thermoanaerobaculaceae bacterium]|nr:Fe-S cluster protein [Thermoanaerobaculaceae bacterium]